MSSMVTINKDAKRIWQEIEKVKNTKQTESVDPHYDAGPFAGDLKHHGDFNKMKEEINKDPNYNVYPERGPNDLEQRIHDLMKINVEHHNLNAELRKDIKQLEQKVEFYTIQLDQLKKENQELRGKQQNPVANLRDKGGL